MDKYSDNTIVTMTSKTPLEKKVFIKIWYI